MLPTLLKQLIVVISSYLRRLYIIASHLEFTHSCLTLLQKTHKAELASWQELSSESNTAARKKAGNERANDLSHTGLQL